jgi:hypothetical protein
MQEKTPPTPPTLSAVLGGLQCCPFGFAKFPAIASAILHLTFFKMKRVLPAESRAGRCRLNAPMFLRSSNSGSPINLLQMLDGSVHEISLSSFDGRAVRPPRARRQVCPLLSKTEVLNERPQTGKQA